MRPDKMEYFLSIALNVARRSTCLRRNYGAVIVDKRGHIISTGYNGQPHGVAHCQVCYRQEHHVPPGERYELCRSIHAEMNALLIPSMEACEEGVMYLAGFDHTTGKEIIARPCTMCWRIILNTPLEAISSWMRGDKPERMPLRRVRERCPDVIVEGVTLDFWERYDRSDG
ncbi:MAG: cytidine deaminase [Candidatus Latescibacteria bacterium]|nr:cytidine deaminase [Candidatus Latescibacterota bacterium]